MKYKYNKTSIVLIIIAGSVLFFANCVNNQSKDTQTINDTTLRAQSIISPVDYAGFVGSVVCADCHKTISHDYLHTAHYLTSQPASKKTIKGSFTPGENYYAYRPDRVVVLESRDSGLYQVYYSKRIEKLARRFDIVIGSGTNGQTYLSWLNDQIIELPVSYFTLVKAWENSPGYPLSPIVFNRLATTRCLECHTTLATTTTPPLQEPEKFDSTKMILTISCEKCHGPAAQHVAYERQHLNDTVGQFITDPGKLPYKLKMDVCNLCHSGRLQKTQPSFSFIAGDTLANYFSIDTTIKKTEDIDVHGNQFGLLASSKCFTISKTLACTTCHDVHKNERGKLQLFSQRCMNCHTNEHKPVEGISNKQLINNCIDCHMPEKPSHSIEFILQGRVFPTPAFMRTHFITVYPDETKKFIENIASSKKKKS